MHNNNMNNMINLSISNLKNLNMNNMINLSISNLKNLKDLVANFSLPNTHTLIFIDGIWQKEFSEADKYKNEFALDVSSEGNNSSIQINIPANSRLSKPLHLLFFVGAQSEQTEQSRQRDKYNEQKNLQRNQSNHRAQQSNQEIVHKNLIMIGANSEVEIIEELIVLPAAAIAIATTTPANSTQITTYIQAEQSAKIHYYKINNSLLLAKDDAKTYVESNVRSAAKKTVPIINSQLQLELAAHCSITTNHLIFADSHCCINEKINAALADQHISCTNKGLYLLGDAASNATARNTQQQHPQQQLYLDIHIEHIAPSCTSKELFKGVIAHDAQATFTGKITVRAGAHHSVARLDNKNLLLHDEARVTTSPELEIYADDVQCSHGATVGQLDENALWYLQSRGIEEEAARHILTRAFMQEIIGALPIYLQKRAGLS